MDWNTDTQCVAVDTETMGLRRSDYPFAVSLCDDQGNNLLYQWYVNPKTRIPTVPKCDIKEIKDRCRGKTLVFHNLTFDIQKLEMVGCRLRWRHNSYDTGVMWHVINSHIHRRLQGRLKELSLFYLDIPDDDQSDLRKAVTKARALVKKHNLPWKIAEKESKDDHIFCDYWLPRAVCEYSQDRLLCWLKINQDEEEAEKEWWYAYSDPDHVWLTLLSRYANTDTERTMLLYLLAKQIMSEWDEDDPRHRILDRERKLTAVVHDMQESGIHIFPQKIQEEIKRHEESTHKYVRRMRKVAGKEFNVESPMQLSQVLFNDLHLPPGGMTPTGQYSTNKDVRAELVHHVDKVRISRNKKAKSFVHAWDGYKDHVRCLSDLHRFLGFIEGDVLYTTLNQVGAETTRFSSPMHNIKKKGEDGGKIVEGLRSVFGPREGRVWYCLDYKQMQLIIFAYLAGEDSFLEALKAGKDAHGYTASRILKKPIEEVTPLERREKGKNVNFGFIFGESIKKIAYKTGLPDIGDILRRQFPSATEYMNRTKAKVRQYGFVTTPHGYRLHVEEPHKGVNYEVQGCEGDVMKQAMVNCEVFLAKLQSEGFNGYMSFQLHDELIFDFPGKRHVCGSSCWYVSNEYPRKIIHELKRLMERPGKEIGMELPVDIEYTTTDWSETKEYKSDL